MQKTGLKRLSRAAIIITLLAISILAIPLAQGSEFYNRKTVTIQRQDSLSDDIYVFANYGKINGLIDGDLTGFCYDINSSGEVLGNVNLFAYRAGILGNVGKSARLFGNYVSIDGAIGKNLICFGNEVGIGEKSTIGRDLTAGGNKVTLDGSVKGNAKLGGSDVIISGTVEGNVDIDAENIVIIPPAVIKGYLHYTSLKEATIEEGATVLGGIEKQAPKEDDDKDDDGITVFSVIFRILLTVMTLITGLLMILFFREHTNEAVLHIERKFWVTLAVGCLSFIVFTAGALVLMILIIFIPVAIFLLCLGLVLFYIGKVYLAILVGRKLLQLLNNGKKYALGWEFVLGLVVLGIVFIIPYLGWLVYIFAFLIGMGAAVGGYISLMKRFRAFLAGSPSAPAPSN